MTLITAIIDLYKINYRTKEGVTMKIFNSIMQHDKKQISVTLTILTVH